MNPTDARSLFDGVQRLAIITGSGVSAESGIPTFRDTENGLWADFDPMTLATPEGFLRDAPLVWAWYAWRRHLVAGASPNPGHTAISELLSSFASAALITQNVDDLHERAGSRNVIHLHGELMKSKCFDCHHPQADSAPPLPEPRERIEPPQCLQCGGRLRPDVVWFGEVLPPDAWEQAMDAVSTCDLLIVAGTSGQVYPAASLVEVAYAAEATVIQINPEPTPLDRWATANIRGRSGDVLPELVRLLSRPA